MFLAVNFSDTLRTWQNRVSFVLTGEIISQTTKGIFRTCLMCDIPDLTNIATKKTTPSSATNDTAQSQNNSGGVKATHKQPQRYFQHSVGGETRELADTSHTC